MDNDHSWYELVLRSRPGQVDLLTGLLAEQGFANSELRSQDSNEAELVIYLEAAGAAQAASRSRALTASLPAGMVTAAAPRQIDNSAWADNWKSFFPRLPIGKRLEVIPPWEQAAPDRDTVIINPGLAFGTGQHATTRCCLELLDLCLRAGDSVADVGCGSGVLALAALRMGANSALATDNDPVAVTTTLENARLNSLEAGLEARVCDGPPSGGLYDLVFANILASTLVHMQAALTRCVAPGGRLVLSGIDDERLPIVQTAFIKPGWTTLHCLQHDGWSSIAICHKEAST